MDMVIEVKDLNVSYRTVDGSEFRAVEGVSFHVAPGETLGLMGESGCGKSSVGLAMMGLLDERRTGVSGTLKFRGENLASMNDRALEEIRGAGISMIYQEPGIALSPVMCVGSQIAEVVHAHKRWKWEKCREEAHSILARVGLERTDRVFSAYPHQLSGGQLQRVVLAQALVCGPSLLIADEPTSSLDARSQAEFIGLLRDLKERSRLSLLLISHTPEIQASLADRLAVMREGRIVEEGGFETLYEGPRHPYTRALLRRPSAADDGGVANRKHLVPEQLAG